MGRQTSAAIGAIHGGLVVSCQVPPGHPLRTVNVVPALAECARDGCAQGVRVDGASDVRAVRSRVELPIIGIRKRFRDGKRPLITPTYRDCVTVVRAGADIIAVEATAESPMDTTAFAALVHRVHNELGVPVMADVSTYAEGMVAWQAGADLVGTTLSGYTGDSAAADGPDLTLLDHLASGGVRVVLEGRVHSPTDVTEGFVRGAWAVVVGKAITDPLETSARFSLAAPRGRLDQDSTRRPQAGANQPLID